MMGLTLAAAKRGMILKADSGQDVVYLGELPSGNHAVGIGRFSSDEWGVTVMFNGGRATCGKVITVANRQNLLWVRVRKLVEGEPPVIEQRLQSSSTPVRWPEGAVWETPPILVWSGE